MLVVAAIVVVVMVAVFYILDMCHFVGRLITEQKVDGMFTSYVRSTDPHR